MNGTGASTSAGRNAGPADPTQAAEGAPDRPPDYPAHPTPGELFRPAGRADATGPLPVPPPDATGRLPAPPGTASFPAPVSPGPTGSPSTEPWATSDAWFATAAEVSSTAGNSPADAVATGPQPAAPATEPLTTSAPGGADLPGEPTGALPAIGPWTGDGQNLFEAPQPAGRPATVFPGDPTGAMPVIEPPEAVAPGNRAGASPTSLFEGHRSAGVAPAAAEGIPAYRPPDAPPTGVGLPTSGIGIPGEFPPADGTGPLPAIGFRGSGPASDAPTLGSATTVHPVDATGPMPAVALSPATAALPVSPSTSALPLSPATSALPISPPTGAIPGSPTGALPASSPTGALPYRPPVPTGSLPVTSLAMAAGTEVAPQQSAPGASPATGSWSFGAAAGAPRTDAWSFAPSDRPSAEPQAESLPPPVDQPPTGGGPAPIPAVDRPRKRAAWPLTLVGVLVAVAAGIALVFSIARPEPGDLIASAVADIGSWNGARYQGAVAALGGGEINFDLTVTADGTAGTLSRNNGATAELRRDSSGTLLKANREWWLYHHPARADDLADAWVADPLTETREIDSVLTLHPAALAEQVRPDQRPAAWEALEQRVVDGQSEIMLSDGTRHVVVAAAEPHRLVALDIREVEESAPVQVSDVPAEDADTAKAGAAQVRNAESPRSLTQRLLERPLVNIQLQPEPLCAAPTCGVTVTVTNSGPVPARGHLEISADGKLIATHPLDVQPGQVASFTANAPNPQFASPGTTGQILWASRAVDG